MKTKSAIPQMSEEEKKQRIIQVLAQKRETIAVNVLCHLAGVDNQATPDDKVTLAVSLADKLLEKLYSIVESSNEQGK